MKADIVVYDKNGQLAAVIEVKNKKGTSKDWAVKLRQNLYAHGDWPQTPYFLLALPDRLYLWKNAANTPEMIEPAYEVDVTDAFKPYYERSGISPEKISGESFELLFVSWLHEMMLVSGSSTVNRPSQDWLINSGLLETIKTGRIVSEAEI